MTIELTKNDLKSKSYLLRQYIWANASDTVYSQTGGIGMGEVNSIYFRIVNMSDDIRSQIWNHLYSNLYSI